MLSIQNIGIEMNAAAQNSAANSAATKKPNNVLFMISSSATSIAVARTLPYCISSETQMTSVIGLTGRPGAQSSVRGLVLGYGRRTPQETQCSQVWER